MDANERNFKGVFFLGATIEDNYVFQTFLLGVFK